MYKINNKSVKSIKHKISLKRSNISIRYLLVNKCYKETLGEIKTFQ